jgi:hypothetical protein
VLDAIGEEARGEASVVGEDFGDVGIFPASAVVLERLREVPVEEGAVGLDAGGEECVDEAVVEVGAPGCRGPS